MSNKLTAAELVEPMMITWGRIVSLSGLSEHGKPLKKNPERLVELIRKFNNDLKYSKLEEGYFKK